MKKIDIKLQADVSKVVELYENEILKKEETEKLLSQFTKEDLIAHFLNPNNSDEEDFADMLVGNPIEDKDSDEEYEESEDDEDDEDNGDSVEAEEKKEKKKKQEEDEDDFDLEDF